MELIKRGTDYALRALVHLATSKQGVESAASIAAHTGIPQTFLQKLMQKLTKAGVIEARVGATGGLFLALDPSGITLKQILDITQGPFKVNRCLLGANKCSQMDTCPLTQGWCEVQQRIDDYLNGITLAELVSKARESGRLP